MEALNNPFQLKILTHLQELAEKDELFAVTLNKPNKNIADCETYVVNQVQKTGRAGFEDEEIYAMAIHYYDEDSIELGKPIKATIVINEKLSAPPKAEPKKSVEKVVEKPKEVPKPEMKVVHSPVQQFDLFGNPL